MLWWYTQGKGLVWCAWPTEEVHHVCVHVGHILLGVACWSNTCWDSHPLRSTCDGVYTDSSLKRGVESSWAYSARQNGLVVAEGSGSFVQTTLSMCIESRVISEAITLRNEDMFMLNSSQTNWALKASLRVVCVFSPLVYLKTRGPMCWSAELRGTLFLDPPAVRASYARDADCHQDWSFAHPWPHEGKESGSLIWVTRHASWVNQATCQPDADEDSHTLRWTLQRRGESSWMTMMTTKIPDGRFKVFQCIVLHLGGYLAVFTWCMFWLKVHILFKM